MRDSFFPWQRRPEGSTLGVRGQTRKPNPWLPKNAIAFCPLFESHKKSWKLISQFCSSKLSILFGWGWGIRSSPLVPRCQRRARPGSQTLGFLKCYRILSSIRIPKKKLKTDFSVLNSKLSILFGWGWGIRTPDSGFRVHGLTAWRIPSISGQNTFAFESAVNIMKKLIL